MEIQWTITDVDVSTIKAFMRVHGQNPLVKERVRRNIERRPTTISPEDFWYYVVACLLTTQQRSGPDSAVMKFLSVDPFSLGLDACRRCDDLLAVATKSLTDAGGIRRAPTIAKELLGNLEWMEDKYWPEVENKLRPLLTADDPHGERAAARWIDAQFYGFGPKQSRNLLQMLGLTRYEIPLDSRVAKRLNEFGFPLRISAGALADEHVYEFMMDGVQALCRRCEIYPCVFDAAMFASFDGNGWDGLAIVW
jgi:hypothetical protein